MRTLDFWYDGQCLSDYNFVVCDFSGSSGISEVSAGSTITFVKVARNNGAKYSLTNTKYNECLSATFDICKNPDVFLDDDMEITADEFRDIMRWLNRKEYLPFHFISDDGDVEDIETCWHNASFNLSKLMLDERTYGIRLKLETNMPNGYGEEKVFSWSATKDNLSRTIMDISDEIGYIYPTLIVTCKQDCELRIVNESEGCSSVIKNCKAGEQITMYGDTNIIASSYAGHDVCNDFNYDFFRIGNSATRMENVVTVSHPCDIVLKYHPIIKYAQL